MSTHRLQPNNPTLASAPRENNGRENNGRDANVLPLEFRLALQSAARVKNPHERAKAIAKATARAKREHPEFFR